MMVTGGRDRPPGWISIARWMLTGAGALGIALILAAVANQVPGDALGALTADPSHPYQRSQLGGPGAYLYSPAFIQVVSVVRDLPGFVTGWRIAEGMALVAMAGPFSLPLALTSPVFLELKLANIDLLLGLAILAGFRWPAAWSFVLLTKVTPGIGLLWFAVRREWSHLAVAAGVTALIAAASFVLGPAAWFEWFAMLLRESGADMSTGWTIVLRQPLVLRLAGAAILVGWGASRNQRWTVVFAAFVALPVTWATAATMLVATIPLFAANLAGVLRRAAVVRREAVAPVVSRRPYVIRLLPETTDTILVVSEIAAAPHFAAEEPERPNPGVLTRSR